jgi:hypothetical protein
VCYRGFEQSWRSVQAPRSGRLVLSLDTSFPGIASTSQVLYRSTDGNWLEAVVARTDIATRIQRGIDRLLVYGGGGLLAFAVLLNTLGVLLCTRHRRRKAGRKAAEREAAAP